MTNFQRPPPKVAVCLSLRQPMSDQSMDSIGDLLANTIEDLQANNVRIDDEHDTLLAENIPAGTTCNAAW